MLRPYIEVWEMSDEVLHPGHRSVRLKDYDYSAAGFFFVTICAYEKRCIFGRIVDGQMELTAVGRIGHESWIAIPSHFPSVSLHAFVIMPNHVHGIIEIGCQAGAQHAAPLQRTDPKVPQVAPGSLVAIVRSFKAGVTLRARREQRWAEEIWQRNYFERVVRDGQELSDATRYIAENLMKWERDRENPLMKQQ